MMYRYTPKEGMKFYTSTFPTLVCEPFPSETCNIVYETVSSSEPLSPGYELFISNSSRGNRKDPTPYYFEKTTVVPQNGSSVFSTSSSLGTTTTTELGLGVNNVSTPIDIPPFDYAIAYNNAVADFYGKIRGNIDLSIDIAQMGQTRRMLKDASRLQVKLLSYNPKVWANRWLQFQYGWRPLAQTLYESASRVVKQDYSRFTTIRGRGQSVDSGSPNDPRFSGSKKRSHRVLIQAQYDSTQSLDVARWTSLNPLSIAWELMPYSFVVDWFYDIGGYIRDVENSFLYRTAFTRGFISSGIKEETSVSYFESASGEGFSYTKNGGFRDIYITQSRSLLSGAPSPTLPRFSANLGSQRLISAASLLAQFLGGKSRP